MSTNNFFLFCIFTLFARLGVSQEIRTVHYAGDQILPIGKEVSKADDQLKDDRVRIVVEFNALPLARVMHRNQAAIAQQRSELQALQKQFEDDLGAIGRSNRNSELPVIHFTYYDVLAGVALSINEASTEALSKLPYVKKIHPDVEYELDLTESVPLIGADQVWIDLGLYGDGIVVGIMDTGIDYTHPALGAGIGSAYKVIGGYDFYDGNNTIMDVNGHGTHVAGIVAADGADIKGVAPHASLYGLKVFNDNGFAYTSILIAAAERSVDPNQDGDYSDKLDVVNMSLGKANGAPDDVVCVAVENAISMGVTYTISAGNNGETGPQSIGTPGTAVTAITVGASDKNDHWAPFSSYGPNNVVFGIKPELVAPGVGINSTYLAHGYVSMSGTSMAAPHVAGVCALLKQAHPDWTPEQLKSAVLLSADDIGEDIMKQGSGRLNARKAFDLKVLSDPAQLSFGIIDPVIPLYTTADTLKLTNISNQEQLVTIGEMAFAEGVQISTPVNEVLILPGDSAFIPFELMVNNALFLYPDSGAIACSDVIRLVANEDTLRIPWSFTKARRIHLVINGSFWYDIFNAYNHYDNSMITLYNTVNEYDLVSYADTLNFVANSYWSTNDIYTQSLACTGLDTVYILHDSLVRREVEFKDEAGEPLDYSPFYIFLYEKNYADRSYEIDFLAEEYSDGRFYTSAELSNAIDTRLGIFKANEDTSKLYVGTVNLNDTDLSGVIPNEAPEYTKLNVVTPQTGASYIRWGLWHNFHGYMSSISNESFLIPTPWAGSIYLMDDEAPNLAADFWYHTEHGFMDINPFQRTSKGIQLYFFDASEFDDITYARIRGYRHRYLNPLLAAYGDNSTMYLSGWPLYGDTYFYNGLFNDNNIYFGTMHYGNTEYETYPLRLDVQHKLLNSQGQEVYASTSPFVTLDLPDDRYTYIFNYTYNDFGDEPAHYQITSTINLTLESQWEVPYRWDNNPPTLTTLQVRNGANLPVSHLQRNSSGKLVFAVADLQPHYPDEDSTTIDVAYYPVDLDSISVFIKASDSTHWIQTGFQYLVEDSLIGRCFEIDLSPWLDGLKDVDFKLRFADRKGQVTTHTYTPLFRVSECIPVPDTLHMVMNDTLAISVREILLANDVIPEDWLYDMEIIVEDSTLTGALLPNADGNYTYIPAPDYVGYDQFNYRLVYEGIVSPSANVVIDVDLATSVDDVATDGGVDLLCYPNPFKDRVFLEVRNDKTEQVMIYDAVGSLVTVLRPVMQDDRKQQYVWDGTDDRGQALSNGVYYGQLISESGKSGCFRIIRMQ